MLAGIYNWFSKLVGSKQRFCCKDCKKNLYLVLDGEACNETESEFMDHINDCKPCFEAYKVDKSVKELVKFKLEKKEVPTSLVDAIKKKIEGC